MRSDLRRVSCGAFFALASLGSAACGGPGSGDDSGPPPRAVFLIVVDTLRPDHLSCYGYGAHRTPNIDGIADAGVLFRNAHAPASWTIPSMGSVLTARYPTQLGLVEKPGEPGRRFAWHEARTMYGYAVPDDAETLAEIFRDAGWKTAAFVNQPGLNAREGFQQGFDDWFYPVGPGEIGKYDPERGLEPKRWPPFLNNAALLDAGLAREFESWIGAHAAGNVFVWLHFLTPHAPYLPIPSYLPDGVDPRSVPDIEAYDAEIRFTDDVVGQVLRVIRERIGMEHSLVLFTSDHGEAFGEHGMVEHGHSLHGEVARVPLLLADRGRDAGRRTETHVQTLDILPTLVGLALGEERVPEGVGTSLAPVIRGAPRGLPLYAEGVLYGESERSLQEGTLKLMLDAQEGTVQLFDVASDPGETVDLAGRRQAEAARLRKRLTTLHDHLRLPRETEGLSPGVTEALRALGYVE